MRVVTGIAVLSLLGVLAVLSRGVPPLSLGGGATPTLTLPQGGGKSALSALPHRQGQTSAAPIPSQVATSAESAPTRAASIPPPLRPATDLPATLELVALPALPGRKAAAARAISRTEAVASVIASREFQDTVTPIARLYHATFQRFPDYEGINYYTGQVEAARPLAEIADEFVGSREFRTLYGEIDNATFVERMFENMLGSAHQADVRAYWVNQLDTGQMTRGQVLVDLAESGAFRERSNNQVMVSIAYFEVLRRTPDPDGHARWVAHLNSGKPFQGVIDALIAGRR